MNTRKTKQRHRGQKEDKHLELQKATSRVRNSVPAGHAETCQTYLLTPEMIDDEHLISNITT